MTQALFRTLVDLSPDKVTALDLAQYNDLDAPELDIAELLGGPNEAASALGRKSPVSHEDCDPTVYWVEESVAAIFGEVAQGAIGVAPASSPRQSLASASPDTVGARRRSVPAHILEVFAGNPETTEMTVREIAAGGSARYAANEISHGAISAALDADNVDGVEWVPGSSPRKARRKRTIMNFSAEEIWL